MSVVDPRRGFTLLEAVVAMAIVGAVSVAALGAFGSDLRAAARAQQMLPAAALAYERLTTIEIRGSGMLDALPDSLARGRFDAPFDMYSWTATAKGVRSVPRLIELGVTVSWEPGSFTLSERRYAQ